MTTLADQQDNKRHAKALGGQSFRVLVISHNFPSPGKPGEAEFVVQEFQALAEAGVQAHIVAPVPFAPRVPTWKQQTRRALQQSRLKPKRWHVGGMEVDYPRYWKLPGHLDPGLFGPLFTRGIRTLVERLHREKPFDLIHGQWLLPDGYAAAALGRRLGIPSVSSERGYAARCPASGPRRRATKQAIEQLDQVTAVSQALADKIAEIGTSRRPIQVIHTGVDLQRFRPGDREQARNSLNLPPGEYVLCCARVEPVKRPDVAIEAFCRVARSRPEARFVWLGDGSQLPALRAATESAGLSDRVHLPGNVPNKDVPRWLAASDLVLLTSDSEGLPYSLVEAAAAGRPIVATRVGGVPEVVNGSHGILADRGDIDGLELAIGRLLQDSALADQMGREGREYALKHFSWDRYREQMLAVYRELVKK